VEGAEFVRDLAEQCVTVSCLAREPAKALVHPLGDPAQTVLEVSNLGWMVVS
jgi:hypothetical protein